MLSSVAETVFKFALLTLSFAVVTEPPNEIDEPVIVIALLAKCTLSTEPSVMCSELIASAAILVPSTASAANCVVPTPPLAILILTISSSAAPSILIPVPSNNFKVSLLLSAARFLVDA